MRYKCLTIILMFSALFAQDKISLDKVKLLNNDENEYYIIKKVELNSDVNNYIKSL